MAIRVLIRGGGDLASGVALRLVRCGMQVVITELPEPLAVRRSVAFAEAVFQSEVKIEEVTGRRVEGIEEAVALIKAGIVPVIVDAGAEIRHAWRPDIIVDGRMTKQPPELEIDAAPMVIGLGPGFTAGRDCHAVVETMRGHYLGRVYWEGSAEKDTGLPEPVYTFQAERVLRAPANGVLTNYKKIGDLIQQGETISSVNGVVLQAKFSGILRGLLKEGLPVYMGMKIGDLDPRLDERLVTKVSDKALAIGGGVLEAILSRSEMRVKLAVP